MSCNLSSATTAVLFLGVSALAFGPAVASAAPLKVAGVTASSTFPPEGGVSYDPAQVVDGKASTSWVEGDAGSGLGAWIELDLGGTHEVHGLQIWAGMWYSYDFWNRANRPSELQISFSDGSRVDCELRDVQESQRCSFPVKKTSSVRVQIKQVHAGTTWLDTGISEIQVLSPQGGDPVRIQSASASSQLPADGDGSYVPENAFDGLSDTMWCEGDGGDGTGQSLTLNLNGSQRIGSMTLLNGVGGSLPVWMKANRAKTISLAFSDGSRQKVSVKGSFQPEKVSFEPVTTSSVTLTFDEVVKGREFNDLCVSEISFAP